MFFNSLRWKLLITYLMIGIIPILFLANTIYKNMDVFFIESKKEKIKSQASIIALRIENADFLHDGAKKREFKNEIAYFSEQYNLRVIVLDEHARVLQDSNLSDIGKHYLHKEVMSALENKVMSVKKPNDTLYTTATILDEQNQKVIAVVLTVSSTADISENLNGVRKQVIMLTVILIAIICIIVVFMSQIITDPLKKVSEAITEISEGRLDKRILISGMDEISALGAAINNMAEKLEQVDATRQNFVSNVSHELKTPLSSIKVLSESILYEKDASKDMYIEFLRDINSEVDRMSFIIDDLLNLVKIEQRESKLFVKPQNMKQLIDDIIKRLKPLAINKKINLHLGSSKEEIIVNVDEMKMALAITNLIENAIKYTEEGGEVKVSLESDHQNIFITVSDNGIGIEESEITKIFERFYRIDKTRDRDTGGTGLGLAITHAVVLLHGGSIKVFSKINEGTVFTVRIPITKMSS